MCSSCYAPVPPHCIVISYAKERHKADNWNALIVKMQDFQICNLVIGLWEAFLAFSSTKICIHRGGKMMDKLESLWRKMTTKRLDRCAALSLALQMGDSGNFLSPLVKVPAFARSTLFHQLTTTEQECMSSTVLVERWVGEVSLRAFQYSKFEHPEEGRADLGALGQELLLCLLTSL